MILFYLATGILGRQRDVVVEPEAPAVSGGGTGGKRKRTTARRAQTFRQRVEQFRKDLERSRNPLPIPQEIIAEAADIGISVPDISEVLQARDMLADLVREARSVVADQNAALAATERDRRAKELRAKADARREQIALQRDEEAAIAVILLLAA